MQKKKAHGYRTLICRVGCPIRNNTLKTLSKQKKRKKSQFFYFEKCKTY